SAVGHCVVGASGRCPTGPGRAATGVAEALFAGPAVGRRAAGARAARARVCVRPRADAVAKVHAVAAAEGHRREALARRFAVPDLAGGAPGLEHAVPTHGPAVGTRSAAAIAFADPGLIGSVAPGEVHLRVASAVRSLVASATDDPLAHAGEPAPGR